ncbi:GntR family transcriptional regulator [Bosea sp. BIWAKO-01]|uniref:GntR family transcriptional regulator n=1 Tax=Bosea sp. BIWAKO-01 TaxID=506668 RepID=UPI0008534E40|nr:GntR family transcriptional regulator [Bosea sp. BIWAKO-01]GAU80239.1 transcriptional regulator of GntR family [Bosea sp. BIWAKO-01]
MTAAPTSLQIKLASQILSHARLSGWQSGHHLTEDSLLPVLGASRTPIRAAMAHLAEAGVLEKRPNKGFFLKDTSATAESQPATEGEDDDAGVYLAIAMDRLNQVLPDTVSENELIRRYDLSRARLRNVLARIASEGWIERRQGRGWAFQPLIDTIDAYRENYRFRQMMEPTAMRSEEFVPDRPRLIVLAEQQRFVRDSGYGSLSQVELFEINSTFHETLAAMSGNRFVVQTLTRLNHLRRLIEYGRPLDRERVRRVCDEHLAILAPLLSGDKATAATELERHLSGAAQEKAVVGEPASSANGRRE